MEVIERLTISSGNFQPKFLISVWLFPGLMGTANVLSLMEPTKRVDFLHISENISFL